MKTVGLMGGADYLSTIRYLQAIQNQIKVRLGEKRSGKTVSITLDQEDLLKDKIHYKRELIYHVSVLREAGAHFLVLCDESIHHIAGDIRRNLNMPLLHIGESAAKRLKADNIKKVLIIGDRPAMQADYYIHAMNHQGVKVAIPDIKIINELQDYLEADKKDPVKIIGLIETYRLKGVSAVLFTQDFGISAYDLSLNVYNSFDIHVSDIVDEMMKGIG